MSTMQRRWLRSWTLAVVAMACGPVLPGQDDLYKEDLASAQENLAKGKLTKAKDQFEEILDAARTEPEGDRPDEATQRAAREGLCTIDLMRGEYVAVQK